MKSRYRILARRRAAEAPLRLRRLPRDRAIEPVMDDPFDMPSELVDLATGEIAPRPRRRRKPR